MTEWSLASTAKGLRPLAADSRGLVCHGHGSLYRVGYDLKRPSFICSLPAAGLVGRLGNRFRSVDRIFRSAPSHGMVVGGDLFISRRSEIWRCQLSTGQLTLDFVIPDGRRALEFGSIAQPNGEPEIIFGEYFSNPGRRPVRIWGRSNRNSHWTERGVFPTGEIEHIHAVSAIGDRVFVLCGDFEHAAGIWVSDLNLSTLRPLLRGSQTFRAAWITELKGRIFYATDTQLETNHIHELLIDGEQVKTNPLVSLNGSSIYAGSGQDEEFFSTTIECGPPSGNFVKDILETKPGPGILTSKAAIMGIDSTGAVQEVFSAEKDFLPFRLAQFGTFTFPTGSMPPDTLVAYGVALRGVDDTCLIFRRSK